MTRYFFTLIFLIAVSASLNAQSHKLEKLWETDSVFKTPESVLFDKEAGVLYVANIDGGPADKDGKGSIGKLSLDGKPVAVDWVSGLHAPKGMAKYKNSLWVADIDQMVEIDIKAGKVLRKITVDGAVFLNDVTVDPKGRIFVSDSRTKKVHLLENGKASVYLEDLKGPNGLLFHDGALLVLDAGSLHRSGSDKKLTRLAEGMESSTDGIEHVQGKDFIVSAWSGVVYYVSGDGKTAVLLDTRDAKTNAADIGYNAAERIVYVPTFFKNSVIAYKLN